MVAISLYKGNLHKTPDVARRWTTAKPSISIKDFNSLLRRRSRALSRLRLSDVNSPSIPDPKLTDSNPNDDRKVERVKEDVVEECVDKSDSLVEVKNEEIVKDVEKTTTHSIAVPEVDAACSKTVAAVSDKEKRIKEVKERLEIQNEKKHSLVQVLKQIMNAEEQLKRQNSTQANSGRPPLPLQVDNATDSGSMTKVNTPRLGLDGNRRGEKDVVEANLQSRQLPRMTSTSPSSDSQHKKPPSNMMPHSYKTTLEVAGSPSRFAHGAGQGPSSLSASGTNYVASSPSPAASGGTSVFKDVKLPSPWN